MTEFVRGVSWSTIAVMFAVFLATMFLMSWFVVTVFKRADKQADKHDGRH